MDHFIVSARKYRPETFRSVVGQSTITGTLKSAIQKKQLGHAYLFCGPRGVGKTTCARIFAKTINCMNLGVDAEPCNNCESCNSFNESRAFNIHELDAASNNSVEDIRNLTEQVRIPPQVGKYSIYIIDEVHMLSAAAFNAFLKTLEEPPAHAIFILATTEKHKIIPTILSRCQIFDFNRIRVEDIVTYLEYISGEEGIEYEKDAFNIIALKADGAMRDALSIFDQMVSFSGKAIHYQDVIDNLNILDYEYYFRLTDSCLQGDAAACLMIFDEILANGFDGHNLLTGFASHIRDLLVCQDESTLQLLEVGAGIRERYLSQSKVVEPDWIFKALDILGAADLGYKSSRNQRLHVELALLKLCRIGEDSKKKVPVAEKPESSQAGASQPVEVKSRPQEPERAETLPIESDSVEPKDSEKSTPGDESSQEEVPVPETVDPVHPVMENTPPSTPEADIPPVSPAGRRPVKKIPDSGLSIKDALNGVGKSLSDENGTEPGIKTEKKALLESFTEEDLHREWIAYTESIRAEKPRMSNGLKHHLPVLGDALQIELVLSNSQQLEEFNREIKPDLMAFLESKLQNNQFKLIPVIKEEAERPNTLYTPEEKYEHMKKKNPDLGKLRERFNLDFE